MEKVETITNQQSSAENKSQAAAASPISSPSRKPSFLHNKRIIGLLAVVLLVGVGVIAISMRGQNLFTSKDTEVPVSEWATYTNSGFGYSLKYPPTFILDEELSNEEAVSFYLDQEQDDLERIHVLGVIISPPEAGIEILKACLEQVDNNGAGQASDVPEIIQSTHKEVDINGYRACQSELITDDGLSITTIIEKDDKYINIRLANTVDDEKLRNLYNNAVSTFQFTN